MNHEGLLAQNWDINYILRLIVFCRQEDSSKLRRLWNTHSISLRKLFPPVSIFIMYQTVIQLLPFPDLVYSACLQSIFDSVAKYWKHLFREQIRILFPAQYSLASWGKVRREDLFFLKNGTLLKSERKALSVLGIEFSCQAYLGKERHLSD